MQSRISLGSQANRHNKNKNLWFILILSLPPIPQNLMSLYTNRPRMAKAAMVLFFCLSTASTSDLIDEDPASWPGHLQALAVKANRLPVESLDHFPSPQAFFMNYAYSGVPVIFRGGAKSYPAFSRWSDLYLKSLPDARSTLVAVEINRKEKRSLPKLTMPFQEFLTRYRSRNEYLVTALPSFLRSVLSIRNRWYVFQISCKQA